MSSLQLVNVNCFVNYLVSSYGLGLRNSPLSLVVQALQASMEGNQYQERCQLHGAMRAIMHIHQSKVDEPCLFAVALLGLHALGAGNRAEFTIHLYGFRATLQCLLDHPTIEFSDTGRILANYIYDTLAYANNYFTMKSCGPVRDLFGTNNQAFADRVQCFRLLHGKNGNSSVKFGTDGAIHLTVELVFSHLLWCVQRVFCRKGITKIDTTIVQQVLDDIRSQMADTEFQEALTDGQVTVAELAATING
jgi:hypothetical protein